jgi:hypothetical protein
MAKADAQMALTFMRAINILAERQKPAESMVVEGNNLFDAGPDDAARLMMLVDMFGEQP